VSARILMGRKEIAEYMGISGSRVARLRVAHPDFPKPVDILSCGPIWWAEDIEKFAKIPRPVGRPKKQQ